MPIWGILVSGLRQHMVAIFESGGYYSAHPVETQIWNAAVITYERSARRSAPPSRQGGKIDFRNRCILA